VHKSKSRTSATTTTTARLQNVYYLMTLFGFLVRVHIIIFCVFTVLVLNIHVYPGDTEAYMKLCR